MSRFMVTGGAGFIGGHISELLVREEHDVVVFDDFSTGRMENLAAIADRIEIARGDVRDLNALRKAARGVDFILHHAAEISVFRSVNEPEITNSVNVDGTVNVLVSAKDAGVKRVVLASSSAIYGDTGNHVQTEDMLPNPLSPYGASKIAGEYYLSCFYQLYGLETVRLRYFNVFGPRQNPKSQYAAVIPKFIDRCLHGQELRIYGDGEQTRDFTYVENIARANLLACSAPEAAGGVFNIGTGHSISINELAEQIAALAGCEVRIVHDAPVAGDIRYSSGDMSRARKILSFEPSVGFADGLKRTFEDFAAKAGAI